MREFKFDKTYEEFKIAGEVYRVDFSDNAIKRYQLELHKYMKESQRLQGVDFNSLDAEEKEKTFDEAIDALRKFLDCIMGEGAFDELYKASGESTENMTDLASFLAEVVGERAQKLKEKQKKLKYTKHKKEK